MGHWPRRKSVVAEGESWPFHLDDRGEATSQGSGGSAGNHDERGKSRRGK
jgi:hypothetical protein